LQLSTQQTYPLFATSPPLVVAACGQCRFVYRQDGDADRHSSPVRKELLAGLAIKAKQAS